jgi:hypothetical protein
MVNMARERKVELAGLLVGPAAAARVSLEIFMSPLVRFA